MRNDKRLALLTLVALGPLIPVALILISTSRHIGYTVDTLKSGLAFGEVVGIGASLIGIKQEAGGLRLLFSTLLVWNLLMLWPLCIMIMLGSGRWT